MSSTSRALAIGLPAILVAAAVVFAVVWQVTPGPGSTAGWTGGDATDVIHAGSGPNFPGELAGWQKQREWSETSRAFTGQWTSVCGSDVCDNPYPATMNGCAGQRFLVRWRSLGDPVQFAYGEVTGDVGTVVEKQLAKPADRGWAELSGCSWPLWQYSSGHPSTLGDIAVTVQQWAAAA